MQEDFKQIVRTYQKLVFNLVLKYIQNIEDAEEVTQDVFVTVYEKHHGFKNQSQIKTWIYRIAINKSLDFIKARNRKKRFAFITSLFKNDSEQTPITISTMLHPQSELENKEQLERLMQAIYQLKENQKTVIILLKMENKTQAETAEIMGLSYKAVESLFQRAKLNLKSILEKSEGN